MTTQLQLINIIIIIIIIIATVQHKHTATAGQLTYYILRNKDTRSCREERDGQWSTAATELSSCANRTNSCHNETDTRPSESTITKILPHAIDTQILEFTVLHKMWELKGEPNLQDKSALRRNKTGRDITHRLRQQGRQLMYEGCNFNSGNYLFTTDTKYE